MDLDVVFLGTAGSAPTARRGLPALLVRRGGEKLLFDCGEGTQRQLLRATGLVELEHVFLTHFHADHVLGLPGLLKTFGLRGREAPLALYGPPGLRALLSALRPVLGRVGFELSVHEPEPHESVAFEGFVVTPFAVDHGVRAYGWAVVEDERPGRLDPARAEALGVAPGPDLGRLQRGEPVPGRDGEVRPEAVVGPGRPGRKVVIGGDTAPAESTRIAAHHADLLVHEATFLDEEADRAHETRHSTALAAAELAARAEARLLALTHISPRYAGPELRDEARAAFPAALVPRDFDRVEIPLPERGSPVHLQADGTPGG